MKVSAPTLLPILRSRVLGEIVTWLALHPGQDFSITELAQRARTSPSTTTREVNNLASGGLVRDRRDGNQRRVAIDTDNPLFSPLQRLLLAAFGPRPVLEEMLAGFDNVQEAYIYGSWAARAQGQPGRVPNDIDVLLVGRLPAVQVDVVVAAAEARLGRQVSIHQVRPERWLGDDPDAFVTTVRSRPMERLDLRRDV
jgi:DNA-binding transcriptional ArsR family regulator